MYTALAVGIDLIHALSMALWIAALPLLFVKRYPRLRRACAIYAIAFVVLSQLSMLLLDECFLTTLVRPFWAHAGAAASDEWFTVRAARAIFGMAPSERAISLVSEVLIVVTAVGVLVSMRRRGADARPQHVEEEVRAFARGEARLQSEKSFVK